MNFIERVKNEEGSGKWGLDSAQRVCSRASTFLSPISKSICATLGFLILGSVLLHPSTGFSEEAKKAAKSPGEGVMYFGDTTRLGRPFSKDPAVVRFRGRYLMYYSAPPATKEQGWGIRIAESQNLTIWKTIGEVPKSDGPEKKGLCAPGAIVLRGQVHLFYQTYGNRERDAICHAFSDDGLAFTRNPTNPIFAPTGDWNCGRAIDADVIEHKGELLLYWATRDPDYKIQMVGVSSAPVDSDFARDKWTQRCDAPILKPELPWEKTCIEGAAAFKHGGRLYMFYAGAYNNQPQQIGIAVSDDGIKWTRMSDEPILPNGKPGEWNSSESGHPYAFEDEDGKTYLFFQGNNDKGKTWYLSKMRVGWRDGRPVLER